ncbi:hypothetical protein C8Q77DRAFT_758734 [Trametes polyzona]|nr:hypothetical protein C8Q77DRAFT_758734 [Trametes polyzona]
MPAPKSGSSPPHLALMPAPYVHPFPSSCIRRTPKAHFDPPSAPLELRGTDGVTKPRAAPRHAAAGFVKDLEVAELTNRQCMLYDGALRRKWFARARSGSWRRGTAISGTSALPPRRGHAPAAGRAGLASCTHDARATRALPSRECARAGLAGVWTRVQVLHCHTVPTIDLAHSLHCADGHIVPSHRGGARDASTLLCSIGMLQAVIPQAPVPDIEKPSRGAELPLAGIQLEPCAVIPP